MGMSRVTATICAMVALAGIFTSTAASAQSALGKPKSYPLWDFDEQGHTCRAKGRLQDVGYCASNLMNQIISDGKEAIPILISQLRETRPTKEPIYDYWSLTTAGDVAYFILTDLFTDADWKAFNMPGLEPLYDKDCHSYAEDCWQRFLKRHGRKFVQDQWLAAWKKNKDRIYWDDKARCFRVSSQAQAMSAPHDR
jgi:hypothetical protein